MRNQLISLFRNYGAKIKIIYIDVTLSQAKERNKKRENQVDEKVIVKLYKKLDIPDITECHKLIVIECVNC